MTNKYLVKVAAMFSDETKKDIRDTAIIGTLGGIAGFATHRGLGRLAKFTGKELHPATEFGASAATGLGADYAGLKINQAVENRNNNNDSVT